jgi:hypothetical protein
MAKQNTDKKQSKYTPQQYRFVCELLWGSSPVERHQAEESAMFQSRVNDILDRYPALDKSFFEEHENLKKFHVELLAALNISEQEALMLGSKLQSFASEKIDLSDLASKHNLKLQYLNGYLK